MTLRERSQGGCHYLWDDARLADIDERLFDPDWWRSENALAGSADGRGAAYFVTARDGEAWVLRHNRRGGVLARLNHDRYLWIGAARVRAFAELRLLAAMRADSLPVPAPVAARAQRRGPVYRADVIMTRIQGAQPLADRLAAAGQPATAWQALGGVLALFHRAGVWHGDLNARNILIDADAGFHLIDFDKAGYRRPGGWREANLARLRRSLDKFNAHDVGFNFLDADWAALRGGYASFFAAAL